MSGVEGRPEHCAECGAYLSTAETQNRHAAWHMAQTNLINEIARTAHNAATWNRPIG